MTRPLITRLDPRETTMRIAINGAGIAGPTLACRLRESGHKVLLVEKARANPSGSGRSLSCLRPEEHRR
jgi:2-polyprenyl-6-methoxyphenol hydroxylase-like FAD-dependent oxidoreductase